MLLLQKVIPLGDLLILLDGADVDVSQVPDLIFQLRNIPANGYRIYKLLLPIALGLCEGHFVFRPHIIDLFFLLVGQSLALGVQTVDFLIKGADLSLQLLRQLKETCLPP